MAEETRVIYHLEDQETPYLIRINVPAQRVTLADFKQVLNKPNVKFFFKSVDDEIGVVKEEISDENASLPFVNGRVVCWLVSSDTCQSDFRGSDLQSIATPTSLAPPPIERTGVIGDSRPPSFHAAALGQEELKGSEVKPVASEERGGRLNGHTHQPADQNGAGPTGGGDGWSTQRSSQLETTSFCSSEEDSGGRFSQSTGQSSSSPRLIRRQRRRHRRAKTPRMEKVNNINFENMSNDDAVRVLRDIVHKPGPVTLTVAKCWDPSPRGCFSLPRSEPVRPIDPAAWVSHTAAMTGLPPHYGVHEENHLTIHSDMTAVVKAMANPESGLEVRDRMWLKITIPNAFIGSDVVDWLHRSVEGFTDRREARKYAGNLLKAGFIRHTVNKVTFSEQCYYVFGDLCVDLGVMTLLDHKEDSSGGGGSDCDSLGPALCPQRPLTFPYQYPVPHPYSSPPPLHQLPALGGREGGSQHSEGSHSSGSNCSDAQKEGERSSESETTKQEVSAPPNKQVAAEAPGDDSTQQPPTSCSGLQGHDDSEDLPPPPLHRGRQSFCLAVGNPSDFFVDVM
ncbi:segment polarity protein dishevelled homolog DVL-3 isoform X3 [Cyclopterus lumpus]|uniref:segment polarity protein dishevelled homolog DVL-3 isoform X3 n=1 Tax=Cyclopterus lumpus TaxID=8103 RepID=UPI001485E2E4|nr:segment polarity protein dishevelled homolog DVL-3 isoform X3 [Cyclopterus lumpus]